MQTWKILRDCRLTGEGFHHAMPGIARMHNVALVDRRASGHTRTEHARGDSEIIYGTALRLQGWMPHRSIHGGIIGGSLRSSAARSGC